MSNVSSFFSTSKRPEQLPRDRFERCGTPSTRAAVASAVTLLHGLFAIVMLAPAPARAQEPIPKGSRLYEDGPLMQRDFLGRPEEGSIRRAFTIPRIHWTMRYQFDKKTSGSVVVNATEITVWAIIVKTESWSRPNLDTVLLDHEQGHFDITHAAALEARLKIRQLEIQRRMPAGRGADVSAAVADLRRQIAELIAPIHDASIVRQRDYDSETDHGNKGDRQKEARAAQRAVLAQFERQLKSAGAKEQTRPPDSDSNDVAAPQSTSSGGGKANSKPATGQPRKSGSGATKPSAPKNQ